MVIYVLLYGVAVLSPNVCLTLASGSRFRGSTMNYKWQNNKKAFVLSVWREVRWEAKARCAVGIDKTRCGAPQH